MLDRFMNADKFFLCETRQVFNNVSLFTPTFVFLSVPIRCSIITTQNQQIGRTNCAKFTFGFSLLKRLTGVGVSPKVVA
jgi:hypothetical protein